jgi:hypothetical protein
MIAYRIQSDQVARIQEKAREIGQADNVARVGARGVANFLRDWFFGLDRTRANHLGGARTHFYADVARSVQNPTVSGGVGSVSINHVGLAQRWLGGTIRAGVGTSSATGKPTRFLSIPARAEAYGKTPGEFHDLRFVPRRSGGGMLVQALQTSVAFGKKGVRRISEVGGLVMFWLVKQVTQRPDPTAMPDDAAVLSAAIRPMESFLARRLAS